MNPTTKAAVIEALEACVWRLKSYDYQAMEGTIAKGQAALALLRSEPEPTPEPRCEGCGKTIPEHDRLLRCNPTAASDYWAVLNAEIGYQAVFKTEKDARDIAAQHDEAGYSQAVVRALVYRDQLSEVRP